MRPILKMEKLLPLLKRLLIAWGLVCVVGVLVIGGFIMYQIGPNYKDKINTASKQDVRFVLNWCQLGENRIEEVIHSYESAEGYLDAYAIKISHVDSTELTQGKYGNGWFRCDHLDGVSLLSG